MLRLSASDLLSKGRRPPASPVAMPTSPAPCGCCSPDLVALTRRLVAQDPGLSFADRPASSAPASTGAEGGRRQGGSAEGRAILFRNANVFDGESLNTRPGRSVLVQGQTIVTVAEDVIEPPEGARVIDCAGRTLMPGLIDVHWHTMFAAMSRQALQVADIGDILFAAARQAERTLMRGFTTVRDMGGPCFALKRAIDAGLVQGPRIFPSGAMISQTGGHADHRFTWELSAGPGHRSRGDMMGATAVADGRDAVLRSAREQLMLGASQVKIMAGGGVASAYDPIDTTQFLPEEIAAAVQAAADWGTYVAAHAYTSDAVRRCLKAGVRSIEHGQMIDAETVAMMSDHGAVWSLQPFLPEFSSDGGAGLAPDDKMRRIWDMTGQAYQMATATEVLTGWGTDILFNPKFAEQQGRNLAGLGRWYTPAKALRQATSMNATVLDLSGPRKPYAGALGLVRAGACADLLLVDGDPTEDLSLVAKPDESFLIIMKAGKIVKDLTNH